MTALIRRRRLLEAAGLAVAGLVIGFRVAPTALLAEEEPSAPEGPPPPPDAFLRIGTEGSVTVLLAHTEMGQGIWTTLPMLVAEELGCDWTSVRVEHASAAAVYAHTAYGMQMTGGSTTTWSEFIRYRQVGAVAREMLVRAAAKRWGVEPSACRVEKGFVLRGEERLSFASLAEEARALDPPKDVALKPRGAWTVAGRPTPRLDSVEKVEGRAQFGLDVRLPGLLTAVVARPPVFGGRVGSFRADAARAVPGVRGVFEVPSGVAVVADHFWAAKVGRDRLAVEWDLGPGATLDTDKMREEYRRLAGTRGLEAAKKGDVAAALSAAAKTVEADYEVPFLPHATMEPQNCTVRIGDDGCDLWLGTQFQTVDQKAAADILGLPIEKVRVHTTFAGGGFGRRATTSAQVASEAVHVARAARAPVKVVWTREDDMRGGFYRPMWLDRIRGGIDADGRPTAWRQTIVGQSIIAGTPFEPMMVKDGIDGTSVEGAKDSPYVEATPAHLVELHTTKSPVTVLWWRSVGHTHTAFAVESFVDELAHAARIDPLAYRLRLLQKHPRHLGVLSAAADRAKWNSPAPQTHARGIAVHASFGSYVACVAEVSVVEDVVRVHRVVMAIDCGVCVNPQGVAAQLEGATAFALSSVLHGDLNLRDGRLVESNFHDHRLLRIAEMPHVETVIVPSDAKPGGVGEPGVPPVAPAVANAVFAASGVRVRRLPMSLARERRR